MLHVTCDIPMSSCDYIGVCGMLDVDVVIQFMVYMVYMVYMYRRR
jgi:hypothetical protein